MTDSLTDRPNDTAPILRRVAARIIDGVILAVLFSVLSSIFGSGFGSGWLVLGAAATLAYFALFDTYHGTTPGKRVLWLRVEGADGANLPLQQAVAREAFTVVGAVPYIGPVLALAVWIWILVSIRQGPQGQGVHDRWAGGSRVLQSS